MLEGMKEINDNKGGQLTMVPVQRTVQHGTWVYLTSEFEMRSGVARPLWPS